MIVNPIRLDPPTFCKTTVREEEILPQVKVLEGLLSPVEASHYMKGLKSVKWEPVGVQGMKAGFSSGDKVGSLRATLVSQELANELWSRVKPVLPPRREFTDLDQTDWDSHASWRPVGVSEVFRFIRYGHGHSLVTHYDGPYVASPTRRTLQSLVVYLEHDGTLRGGGTRFVRDPQLRVPVIARDLTDWPRPANSEEVLASVKPRPGTGLLFDHRVLHDGEPTVGTGHKTIMRTDIFWEKA